MQMENKIEHIITHVLSGNASANDILVLSEWLNSDEKNKNEFQKLKCYWDAEVSFNCSATPSLAFEKVQRKIKQHKQKRVWMFIVPVAAAVILLFIIPVFCSIQNMEKEQLYIHLSDDSKSEFKLNDGTKVVLNKNSKLTYSNAYGKKKRQVKLVGEAYFEVTKDPQKPFEVEMDKTLISVLGTTFNVKAIENEDYITATLIQGSIRFESPQQQVVLLPNQQLRFVKSSDQIDVCSVDADQKIAWKDDLLRYKSISFIDLLKELESIYQVKFIITNQKLTDKSVTVSGTFSKQQSMEQILQIINKSFPIKWTYENGTYYIK